MKMLILRPNGRSEADHETVLDEIVLAGEANSRAVIASMQSSKPVLVPCRDGGYAIVVPDEEIHRSATYHALLTDAVTPKQIVQYAAITGYDTVTSPVQWHKVTGVIIVEGSAEFTCFVPGRDSTDARLRFDQVLENQKIRDKITDRVARDVTFTFITHHAHATGKAVRDDDDRTIRMDDEPG
jgi:hypothetical protein